MNKLFILLFLSLSYGQLCSSFSYDEAGCIGSIGHACRYNQYTNMCLEQSSSQVGCGSTLNIKACLMQSTNPDGTLASCIFSGYCRNLYSVLTTCQSNLNAGACLSVQGSYCLWSGSCVTVDSTYATQLASGNFTSVLESASVSICTQVTIAAVHAQGIQVGLQALYSASPTTTYKALMAIPGCLALETKYLQYLNCNSIGLTKSACVQITNGKCIFANGVCQDVKDFSVLQCSQPLNKGACLGVTNNLQQCQWVNSACTTYQVTSTTACSQFTNPVSPSVCSAITTTQCYYNSGAYGCDQQCSGNTQEAVCKQSNFGCVWSSGVCLFNLKDQCATLGSNSLACMNSPQYCQMINGICSKIVSMNLASCQLTGVYLNKIACVNTQNPTQLCQYTQSCGPVKLSPQTRCETLSMVNYYVCQRVTSEGCYYDTSSSSCLTTSGNETCTTKGLNKLGCLQTTNTISPCQWDPASGSCGNLEISSTTQCTSLKLVNRIACQNVSFGTEKCRFDSVNYGCILLGATNIYCEASLGLNKQSCINLAPPPSTTNSWACRWLSGQCTQVSSLGSAISCSSLQYVTKHTCELVTQTQTCFYDPSRNSCSTSINPSDITGCTDKGYNPSACAFVPSTYQCYYDLVNKQCAVATATELASISCISNYPNQKTCNAITTTGQYCLWSSISSLCTTQVFPTSQSCTSFTNVNPNLCLAYYQNAVQIISASSYCTYTGTSCTLYTSASTWADCGSANKVNLHACVAYSSPSTQCYFDQTTLTCSAVQPTTLSSINCIQANKSSCPQVTKAYQRCQWFSFTDTITAGLYTQNKCYHLSNVTGNCASYTNVSQYVCSAASPTTNEGCMWSSNNCVVTANFNVPCSTAGLNKYACINSTNQACYYDSTNYACVQITSANSNQINCSSAVNELGCLASTGAACKWSSGACVAVTVSATKACLDYSTGDKVNAIVCASITLSGEYCIYSSGYCGSDSNVNDCATGYNEANCLSDLGCSFNQNVCSSRPSGPDNNCSKAANQNDCLAVTTNPCAWEAGKCQFVNVNSKATCTSVSATNPSWIYNATTCSNITDINSMCQYQSVGTPITSASCVAITPPAPCNQPGLSKYACIMGTGNAMCYFNDQPGVNTCTTIAAIGNTGCESKLNIKACVSVTSAICIFDKALKACSGVTAASITQPCSSYTDASSAVYNSLFCRNVSNGACYYDPVNFICVAAPNTYSLNNCDTDSSINSVLCQNQVILQVCQFNQSCVQSTQDLTKMTCSDSHAQYYRACTYAAGGQACKFTTSCSQVNVNVDCLTLTNVNKLACMMNNFNNKPCQFVDAGLSTSCRYTPDTLQPCSGLNQISCVQNTANPCFFNNNVCYDITATSNTAQCTSGFFFTQSACKSISTPGQACKWDGTNCVAYVIKTTDQCTSFSNPAVPTPSSVLYGEQICAQITTGACYWTAATGCTNMNITTVTCVVPITKGMNSLACIQAIGNCVFTNYQCLNAAIPANTTTSQCTDPSNQGGCTHLNNGQACQWNTSTSTCSSITSFSSCSSYTNVSPSTCSQTTDQPCYWVSGTCTILTSTGQNCLTYGLNQKACVSYTTGLCYHNGKNCVTLQASDLSKIQCTDQINQGACLALTGSCCFWDGTKCQDESKSFSTCSMTNYSQFCCSKVVGQKCQYSGSCQVISALGSVVSCSTAYNQEACIALSLSCYWNNNACQGTNQTNLGCSVNLSQTACTSQTGFCMFTTFCQAGSLTSCANLLNVTNNSYCSTVTDVGCMSSGQKSCSLSASNTPCTAQNINQIGCLNNINQCQWESNSCKQIGGPSIPSLTECPTTGGYSRGICQQIAYCIFNGKDGCTTITITSTTTCTSVNNSKIGTECALISIGKCQFDSVNQQCSTTITGSVCASYVNSLGCRYIQNNCVWSNSSCITSTTSYYSCSQIYTQYWCIRNPYTSCVWNNDACVSYSGSFAACATYTQKPISPGICYYFSTDRCSYAIDGTQNTYCVSDPLAVTCAGAKSPLGCQQVTPSGTCFWDQTLNLCQTIVPATQNMLTCPQLQYTTQTLCLQTVSEGQTCQWNTTLNQCLSADAYLVVCTDLLSQKACVAVRTTGQQCRFTSTCAVSQPSSDLCEDFINLYACVAITTNGQQCQWMGQSCLKITSDYDYTAVLVNQNYCTKLTESNFKFSTINFTCAASQPLEDSCSTPGLNKLGCLQVQKFGCTWSTSLSQCQSFTDPGTYTLCSQYTNISPNVCSTITITGQSCRYNALTYSCEQSGGDICSTSGLNKAACLAVTQQACQWVGYCTTINVIAGIQDCSTFTVPVNAMACAAVDINNQTCKYNGLGGCTTTFDQGFDSCTTPGLNKYACVQVTIQNSSCQFANGFCQNYSGNLSYCNQLSSVNANVCKSLNTAGQPCKFSLVQRGCVSADSTDKCSTLGINKAGCSLSNQTCVWFDEIQKCTCAGLLTSLGMINCSQAIQGNCTGTCKWSNNQCGLALCKDLSTDKCNGTVLNTQYCYLQAGVCQAAYTCNDIFSIDCSSYTVAGVKCTADTTNFGHCTKSGCSQYSISDCSGQCIWQGNSCTERLCQYLSQTTCTGYYSGKQCVWYNGVCIGVTSCQNFELNISASYTAAQIESACKTQTVLGRQCYYQQESAFSSNYQCSSSLCSLRGESQQNCFGAETSLGEVCVLLPNFTCSACEEITDPCLCLSFGGTCDYNTASGCYGKPCSSLGTTQCQNSRCQIYSSTCKVSCSKLKESECTARSSDCHWDSGLSHCHDGQDEVVTINTLKDTVTVISFGYLISIIIIF